jgi:hypothetical protein
MELSNVASPILLSPDPIFGISATKVKKMRQLALIMSIHPSVCSHEKLNAFSRKVILGKFL